MLRLIGMVIGVVGGLIALAMYLGQTEAVTGLIVALATSLPKLIDKIQKRNGL